MLNNSFLFILIIVLAISDFIESMLFHTVRRRVERLEDKVDLLENFIDRYFKAE